MARDPGEFDAARYFRGESGLRFYHVGTPRVRELARSIHRAHREDWTIDDMMAFAEILVANPYLEAKAVGIEVLARARRSFHPALLARWKRWLAANHCANWATTDQLCALLIGPLLVQHPELATKLSTWVTHRNLWVRRASVVGLLKLSRTREGVDLIYAHAERLHDDPHDLIHKAVGWALREAGKRDARRLERYLRAHGERIPRTTLRYAIERFEPSRRRAILLATKSRRG
jgi:3-methyladenine DNA glycosylase AlkD